MNSSLQPGSIVSHYRVISPLGAGGMGEVYMAQDTSLDRAVALKVLPPELVKSEERVRRFIQEAKSASSLSHPHIVTIYEIGRAEARSADGPEAADSAAIHFIAMELISGETLKQKIHGEKTELKTLLRFLSQAAEGLAKAHAAGIVHRDLKPENIMISRDGYAKVLDFGLAKLTERRESGDPNNELTATRDQTREGAVMGTVAYMSPEQVQAKTVDHRSDIFSFGSILYECATRSKPFTADSDLEVMHKILRDKPAPIEERNPEAPSELRRLIRRCMAKSPDQRLQSMKDLAIELGEIADEFDELSATATSHGSGSGSSAGAVAPLATGSKALKLVVAAAVVLGLAGVVFGVTSWLQGRGATRTAAPAFQSMQMKRLTTSGKVLLGALSPDGKYLASVVKDAKGFSLWVKQIVTGSEVQVAQPVPTPFRGITFSPDGNYLYYVNQETSGPGYSILYQIPVLGGTARKILFDIDTGATFSPDGKQLAFMRGYPNAKENALMVADIDGKSERKLAVRREPENFAVVDPSWSPDGKRILAIVLSKRQGDHAELETVDVAAGKETTLGASRWWNLSAVGWVPDGSGVIVTGFLEKGELKNQVWFVSYPVGQPRKITNDLNEYAGISVTSDSKSLTTAQTNQIANLYVAPSGDTRAPTQVTFGSGGGDAITQFGVSTIGIAFIAQQGSNSRVWSMRPDGSNRSRLSSESGQDTVVGVSHDGSTIVFQGYHGDGLQHVWKMGADGTGVTRLSSGNGERLVALSPDGRQILYEDQTTKALMGISADGGSPRKIADMFISEGGFSPDGKRIAYDSFVQQQHGGLFRREVAVVDAETGKPVLPMTPWPDGFALRWAPSGDALVFIKESEGVGNLWSQPLDGSAAKRLTDFPALQIFFYAWSPDGKQIYFSRGQFTSDMVLISDFH